MKKKKEKKLKKKKDNKSETKLISRTKNIQIKYLEKLKQIISKTRIKIV